MDSKRWRRANVLAVDDQPANLVALDAVLSGEFNLVRACAGEEALSILRSRDDIDVILMDVQMPGMDGFEAAARIKRLPGCRDIPIVFVTAVYHEDPFVKQGYEVGAVDYFSKPFDPEILRLKVGIYASFHQKADLLKAWAQQVECSEELLRAGRQYSAMLDRRRGGGVVTGADVAESKRIEDDLERCIERLESATRAQASTMPR
jgi:CheY-like chemotaxis protein